MSVPTHKLIKLAVRLLITGGLLVWVFAQVDLAQFWQTVRSARWHFLLGVYGATVAFFWIQSMAMRRVLRKQDCDVSTGLLFGASCITALYSLVLPGILSTGVKWLILKRHTGKGSNVLSSMLYNQVMMSVVMVAVGLAGLILTNPTRFLFPGAQRLWILPAVCTALLVLILLVTVLLLNGRTGGPVTRLLAALLRPVPAVLRDKLQKVLDQLTLFQTAGFRFHGTIAFINTVAGLFVGLTIYFFSARAAGVEVDIKVLLWLCATIFILAKIPISVANLGVREVTLVGLLTGYGVTKPAALLMSMILFSSLIFMAALGMVYQLCWLGKTTHEAVGTRTGQ